MSNKGGVYFQMTLFFESASELVCVVLVNMCERVCSSSQSAHLLYF